MPPPTPEEVHERLRHAFKKGIPSGRTIARRAVTRALEKHEAHPEWIKDHFSKLVEEVQLDAYKEYQEAEATLGGEVLKDVFLPLVGKDWPAERVLKFVGTYFYSLDRFFLGLTQGRRPRAGGAFELLIKDFFVRLKYPFTPQAVINGQPDFILPSLEHFREDPPDCIIFTVKRTLRERWRQIVTEGARGLGFFLATIDENIAPRDLIEMHKSRIRLVVPKRIKESRADYEKAPNVITFENFFRDHLDPSMTRWKNAGVI
jgi:hypothetical protein